MYQGNGHQFDNKFDNISDLMERYYNDGSPEAHDLVQSTVAHCATWQGCHIALLKRQLKNREKRSDALFFRLTTL